MKKKNHGDKTTVITVYMPKKRADDVKLYAETSELSVSQLVNHIVKQYLKTANAEAL